MFHFSFSLSHTLTVFLYLFGLHLSTWSSLFLCVLHSLELTKMAKYGSLTSALLSWPKGLSFLSFLLFQFQRVPHAYVAAQGMACWANSFNELWPVHVDSTHTVLRSFAPNSSHLSTRSLRQTWIVSRILSSLEE